MNLIDTQKYEHKGIPYEVKTYSDDDGFVAMAFYGGQPVSPKYTASYEVAGDWLRSHEGHVRDHLAAMAKSDMENEMYIYVPTGEEQQGIRIKPRPGSMLA